MSEPNASGQEQCVTLPPILDITAATELKRTLETALAEGTSVEIDAANVQRVGTPGLQVLVAAVKTFAGNGTGLRIGGCAPALLDAIKTLALGPALGIQGE